MRRSLVFGICSPHSCAFLAAPASRVWLGSPMGELMELTQPFLIAEVAALVLGFAAYYASPHGHWRLPAK